MERADLLYSGLIFAALLLSLWTAALLTVAFVFFAPRVFGAASVSASMLPKSASRAATISSTEPHVSQEPAPSRSLSEAAPARSISRRPLRLIQ